MIPAPFFSPAGPPPGDARRGRLGYTAQPSGTPQRGREHCPRGPPGSAARRGTEVVITAPTRNRMVRETWHKGSNPFLSATDSKQLSPCLNGLFCFLGAHCNPQRAKFRKFLAALQHPAWSSHSGCDPLSVVLARMPAGRDSMCSFVWRGRGWRFGGRRAFPASMAERQRCPDQGQHAEQENDQAIVHARIVSHLEALVRSCRLCRGGYSLLGREA